ncbi:MAG: hypothetical protein R3D78_08080 [Paracoccaceae bacterium]
MTSVFSALISALFLAGRLPPRRCRSYAWHGIRGAMRHCHGPDGGAGNHTRHSRRAVNVLRCAPTGADGMPEFELDSAEIAALHAYLGAGLSA